MSRRKRNRAPAPQPPAPQKPETAAEAAPAFDVSRLVAVLGVAILIAAAFALRIWKLGHLPYWNDESLQLKGLMLPFSRVREHLHAIEFLPPLSFWIQRPFWLLSQTMYAGRVPGVIAGTLMVPLAYWCAARLTNRLGGLIMSALVTFSFFLVYYSQECRTYIFFGWACGLFIGLWLGLLLERVPGRVAWWRWAGLGGAGLLCAGLHFGTMLLMPAIGAATTLVLAADYWRAGAARGRSRGAYLMRWGAYAGVLLAVQAAAYLIMKWSMNPNWDPMNRVGGGMPGAPAFRMTAGYVWGSGWRWLPFVLAVSGVWVFARGRLRRIGAGLALVALLPLGMAYVAMPGFLAVSRYLFWIQWCAALLAAIGLWAAVQRIPRAAGRILLLAGAAIVYAAIHVPFFRDYYAMTSKGGGDLPIIKRGIEGIDGRRVLVMANGYHMHHLQTYWPTNCTFSCGPYYGSAEEYQALQVREWLEEATRLYPDIAVYIRPGDDASGLTYGALTGRFASRVVDTNDAATLRLFAAGFNMNATPPDYRLDVLFTPRAALLDRAKKDGDTLMLFDGRMPIVSTYDPSGGYRFWRLLQEPSELTILNPAETNRHVTVPVTVAKLSPEVVLGIGRLGGPVTPHVIPAAQTPVVDPQRRVAESHPVTAADAMRIGNRMPMQIASAAISVEVDLAPGANTLVLFPQRAAMLIGPPAPDFLAGAGAK